MGEGKGGVVEWVRIRIVVGSVGKVLVTVLNRGSGVGIMEKVAYMQRLEEGERISYQYIQEKSVLKQRPKGTS